MSVHHTTTKYQLEVGQTPGALLLPIGMIGTGTMLHISCIFWSRWLRTGNRECLKRLEHRTSAQDR
jgi:hypothetical protein